MQDTMYVWCRTRIATLCLRVAPRANCAFAPCSEVLVNGLAQQIVAMLQSGCSRQNAVFLNDEYFPACGSTAKASAICMAQHWRAACTRGKRENTVRPVLLQLHPAWPQLVLLPTLCQHLLHTSPRTLTLSPSILR